MKKFTVVALALTTLLSSSVYAHEAGEFFMRAGPATVRPTEGAGGTLGHLNGFDVSNNTQLGPNIHLHGNGQSRDRIAGGDAVPP
ncbi:Outer membrane protein W [Salmonella enterica subsp. arizonae]|uniref:Outer membrane protein W n=1 Tax=Salmonella enterica subsp. arizonae TaxID=59203 RepID=A0A379S3V7_SALER|nr:Outer membrane protein W [Salmonella enterica subsp. arizonae]